MDAFTLIELLAVLWVIGILIFLAMPGTSRALIKGQMTGTLSNARLLQTATQAMTLDNRALPINHPETPENDLQWTSLVSQGRSQPAAVAQYFGILVKSGYLTENDLRKLLTAPLIGPGTAAPSAQNSCFKFFAVDEASPQGQPLLVTANWDAGRLTGNAPYGMKGFVVFTKGGNGGIYRLSTDLANSSVFPVGKDFQGHAYRYEVLK